MVAREQYVQAIAAARQLSSEDHQAVELVFERAGLCDEMAMLFAQRILVEHAKERVDACRTKAEDRAIDSAISTGDFDTAEATITAALARFRPPRTFDFRLAYIAASRSECEKAHAFLDSGIAAGVVDARNDSAFVAVHCPAKEIPAPDESGRFVGALVGNRFALGGRRSSRGLVTALVVGTSGGDKDGTWFEAGFGPIAIRPGDDGADGQLSSAYGVVGAASIGTSRRNRVGIAALYTFDFVDGKYVQGVDDIRRAFVIDAGIALQLNLTLGGGFALHAYGGIRGGVAFEHTNLADGGFGSRFHGVSGLDAGGALTWVCCFK